MEMAQDSPKSHRLLGSLYCSVIIPALNEEQAIAELVRSVRAQRVDEVIVVDNGSADMTSERAQGAGARVISEPRRGYGRACLAGIRELNPETEVIVFLDGDGSDVPEMMDRLLHP